MKLFGNSEVNDTDAETERVMIELWRKAPAWRKIQQVFALNAMLDSLMRANIVKHNPHADETEIRRQLAKRKLPPELFVKVYGADDEGEAREDEAK